MKRIAFLLIFLFAYSLSLSARDTLRVTCYNLLYYGGDNAYCDRDCKDEQLRTILAGTKFDILGVNEINNGGRAAESNSNNILTSVLNTNGEDRWMRAPIVTGSTHNPLNALFYNSEKLGYLSRATAVSSFPRHDIYRMYYKSNNLDSGGDTLFLYIGLLHHKAGSGSSDEAVRSMHTSSIINLLEADPKVQNLIFMGDFNCQASDDLGLAPFLEWNNASHKLNDPINRPGRWNNKVEFASIHTQSTRTEMESDGGSSGGSDDRLDLILCSNDVMNNSKRVQFISSSYEVTGQDGSFFNGSMLQSSSPLKTALYRMSDHMPVHLDLDIDAVPLSAKQKNGPQSLAARLWPNPVADNQLNLIAESNESGLNFRIVDMLGRILDAGTVEQTASAGSYSFNVSNLPQGVYILHVANGAGSQRAIRFVRQ